MELAWDLEVRVPLGPCDAAFEVSFKAGSKE